MTTKTDQLKAREENMRRIAEASGVKRDPEKETAAFMAALERLVAEQAARKQAGSDQQAEPGTPTAGPAPAGETS